MRKQENARGGLARLRELPLVKKETLPNGSVLYCRGIRGVRNEGSMSGIYHATEEVIKRGKYTHFTRLTIVHSDEEYSHSAVFENRKPVPIGVTSNTRRVYDEIGQRVKASFDSAEDFHITDPALIDAMSPAERVLRELYVDASEVNLDPSPADSGITYGLLGDSR